MSPATTALGVVLATAGAGLIYSAFTGQSPMDELRKVLETGTVDGAEGRTPLNTTSWLSNTWSGFQSIAAAAGTGSTSTSPRTPPTLVPIGQGSFKLTPAAAAALSNASRVLGRTIVVTDAYRDYDTQARGHRADPERFADPDKSAHPEGVAIDVNLGAMGCTTGRRGDPAYDRLYQALTSTGWCTYTGGTSGDTWHFSYGVCK